MENTGLLIHVQVGGFRFPLRIARKDEEIYRNAEKLLVKITDQFAQKYRERPREEILTLVAFQFAVTVSKYEMSSDALPLAERLKDLDSEIEQLLSEKSS